MDPGAESPEQWVAFLGSPSVARAAWRVVAGRPPAPIGGWPAGVRVLGSRTARGSVFVLVETIAALGQPAGLRGVWVLPIERSPGPHVGWSAPAGPSLTLAGVRDLDELDARLAAIDAHDARTQAAADTNAPSVRATAGRSMRALSSALSSRGVDHGYVWQGGFIEPRGHLDAAAFGRRPEAARLLAQLASHGDVDFWFGAGGDGADVHTVLEGGREVIDGFVEPPPPAPRTEASRRAVAARSMSAESLALLREQVAGEPVPIAEATWGEHGTLSVAAVPSEQAVVVMFHEGDFVRADRVLTDPASPRGLWADPLEAAFADIDGDGRADLVLRGGAGAGVHTWAVLTPRVLPAPSSGRLTDDASAAWVLGAENLDQAVQALLKMPTRAATVAELRRLLSTAARGPERVFSFYEREATDGLVEVDAAERHAWWHQRAGCGRAGTMECAVWCDSERPVCQAAGHSGGTVIPYRSSFYWPVWSGGRMRLGAAAFSTDSSGTLF